MRKLHIHLFVSVEVALQAKISCAGRGWHELTDADVAQIQEAGLSEDALPFLADEKHRLLKHPALSIRCQERLAPDQAAILRALYVRQEKTRFARAALAAAEAPSWAALETLAHQDDDLRVDYPPADLAITGHHGYEQVLSGTDATLATALVVWARRVVKIIHTAPPHSEASRDALYLDTITAASWRSIDDAWRELPAGLRQRLEVEGRTYLDWLPVGVRTQVEHWRREQARQVTFDTARDEESPETRAGKPSGRTARWSRFVCWLRGHRFDRGVALGWSGIAIHTCVHCHQVRRSTAPVARQPQRADPSEPREPRKTGRQARTGTRDVSMSRAALTSAIVAVAVVVAAMIARAPASYGGALREAVAAAVVAVVVVVVAWRRRQPRHGAANRARP